MTKVLLTGGSGFIAAHILEQLLAADHTVVTTVRSEAKAAQIHAAHPEIGKERLETLIVPDIAQPDAFDAAVRVPGLEVVLHTASPFHYRVTDPQKDLIDPAVLGTTGILKALAAHAPTVRRVVVTSSFAAILDAARVRDAATHFNEASWNPVTAADVQGSPATGYLASKTLAEHAAWDFVRDHKPGFDLVTVNPPMVYGPVVHHLDGGVTAINTSNARFVDALTGVWKAAGAIPDTGPGQNWVDVRDAARAHVLAGLEKPEAGGHRLFVTRGQYTNREIYDILRRRFPEYADQLPPPDAPGGEKPASRYTYDNDATNKILGIEWRSLEESVVDTVNSLKGHLKAA